MILFSFYYFYVLLYSIKSVIQTISSNTVMMNKAAEIADLFMDKFRPNGLAMSEQVYRNKEKSLKDSIEKIQSKTARAVLQKMLEATTATLRTNFFLPHRLYFLYVYILK